jgi:prepilin signal peptidase PulO-like enzyme (type II secretory pathway)
MEILTVILVLVFGAVIGSFLNVVVLRFNTGTTIGGRSRCMSCNKQLVWYELIPVISFFIQGGACTKCKSKISRQYPLVELSTGFLFALVYMTFPPFSVVEGISTVLYLIVTCLLVVISAYDIKHKIIPDQFVYSFILISLLSLCFGGASLFHIPSISAFLAGPLLALPFALIWFISKGQWMGLGDAKLLLGIGWLLGLNNGANATVLAFWIAAVISVAWLLIRYRSIKPRTEIPFGPYLILGMYIVLLFNVRVIDFSLLMDFILSFF